MNTFHRILEYTGNCRIIAEFCDKDIFFFIRNLFSAEEFSFITSVAHKMKNPEIHNNSHFTNNPTCTVIANEGCENIIALKCNAEPTTIRIEQFLGSAVILFNQEFTLPPQVTALESVTPIILDDIEKIKPDDHVLIEWLPLNNFSATTYYDKSVAHRPD